MLIRQAITELQQNPYDPPDKLKKVKLQSKALRKDYGKVYRIHPNTKDYRLAYSIYNNTLVLIYVSTRQNFYAELER